MLPWEVSRSFEIFPFLNAGRFVEESLLSLPVSLWFDECSWLLWFTACNDLGLSAFLGNLTSEPVPVSKPAVKNCGWIHQNDFSIVCSHTCEDGAGLCSLSPIRVRQGKQFVDVVRLKEPPLFGILQNAISQELFEDLPDMWQIKQNWTRGAFPTRTSNLAADTIVSPKTNSQQVFWLFFYSTLQSQTKQSDSLAVLNWPFNNAGKLFNYWELG